MTKAKPYLNIILFLLVLMVFSSNLFSNTSAVAHAATIKLNYSEISIPVNTTKQLSITGTSKKVTWSSNNKSVATVNSIGIVTAKSEGTATITASVSGKALKCKVTAYIPMSINATSITLNAGKTEMLEVIGTTKTPIWSSNNKTIAHVSKYGTVTAISKGSAVITATIGTKKLTSKITVIEPIAISNKTLKMKEGQSQSLKIKGISYRATWSTSNSSVATVSIYGTITALKAGKATVTAYVDGEKFPCTVTVYKNTSISENTIILKTGDKTSSLKPPIITPAPVTQAPVEPTIPVVIDNSDNTNSSTETDNTVTDSSSILEDSTTTRSSESKDGSTPKDEATTFDELTPSYESTTMDEPTTSSGSSVSNASTTIDAPSTADSSSVIDNTPTSDSSSTTDSNSQQPTLLWSSSDTKVATVSDQGIVKGLKPGTAIITATYGEQKYTYLVIILSKYNSFLSKAPFPAYQKSWDKVNYLLPSNWNVENNHYSENTDSFAYPNYGNSSIYISIEKTETYAPAYNTIREDLKEVFSLENVNLAYKYTLMNTGYQFKIKNYAQKDTQTDIGRVLKTKFYVTIDGESAVQTFYNFWVNKYYIEMIVTDDQSGRYDVQKMSEYILNTITIEN